MTVLSSRGQVVLPKAVRERLGLEPGQRLAVQISGDGVVLRPERPATRTGRAARASARSGWRTLRGALRGTDALAGLLADRRADVARGR
jgi:AbrB family looped-hinge helix DNA binding protein